MTRKAATRSHAPLAALEGPVRARGHEDISLDIAPRFFELSDDLCVVVDLDGMVRYANRAWTRVLGRDPEEVVGRHLSAFLDRGDWDRTGAAVQDTIREGALRGFENRFLHRDGGSRWIQWNIQLDDTTNLAYGIGRNTTDRHEAEAALAASERTLRSLIDASLDGVILADHDGNLILANPAMYAMLGRDPNDTSTWRRSDIIDPNEPALATFLAERERTGRARAELTLKRADGSTFPADVSAAHLTDAAGGRRASIVVRDASEHHRLIDALTTTADRVTLQAAALEAAANAIVITDPAGTIQWVNPAFTTTTGYEAHEAIGHNPSLLKSGMHDEAFYRELWSTITGGDPWHGELVNRRKDGSLYTEQQTVTPVRDGDGTITHYIAIKQDISESLHAKRELRASEERYRMLAENAVDTVFRLRVHPDLAFEYVSPSSEALTGYTPEEHYADPGLFYSVIHPDDRLALEEAARAGEPILSTARFIHRDGTIVYTEQHSRPIHDDAGDLVAVEGIVRDISERVHAQERAEQFHRRLERQLTRSQAVHRLDTTVLLNTPITSVIDTALDILTQALEVDAVGIFRIDSTRRHLRHLAGRHLPEVLPTIPAGRGIAGEAARTRNAVIVRDADADTQHDTAYLRDIGMRGCLAVPLTSLGDLEGALELFTRGPLALDHDAQVFAETIAHQLSLAMQRDALLIDLHTANLELEDAYDRTIEGWARALDLRDEDTAGHSQRVTDLTLRLAQRLGLPDAELRDVRRGALLHDIGKMAVPDAILLKPGKLTDDEFAVIKRHPGDAYDLLKDVPYLQSALHIPHHHHERWDGTGYPDGLRGQDIPLPARIFAVVDVYDALTSDRPYRPAWTHEAAIDHIRAQAGTHFDPHIVEAFVQMVDAPMEQDGTTAR